MILRFITIIAFLSFLISFGVFGFYMLTPISKEDKRLEAFGINPVGERLFKSLIIMIVSTIWIIAYYTYK